MTPWELQRSERNREGPSVTTENGPEEWKATSMPSGPGQFFACGAAAHHAPWCCVVLWVAVQRPPRYQEGRCGRIGSALLRGVVRQ